MKKYGRNRGITLIALVVTIIVLLILAGISISMLTGQNGILNRAQEAKEKTELAQKEEKKRRHGYEEIINQFNTDLNGGEELPESAEGQKAGTAIKNPSSYGKNPKAQAIADGTGKIFALPTGGIYDTTTTVETGVVVSIKGSQFVWVPVDDIVLDINKKDDLPTSSSNDTSKGKKYTPMAVQDGDNYKGLLYNFSGNNSYLMFGSNKPNYQGNSTNFREPDIVSYDIGDYLSEKIEYDVLISEYNAMIESVKKYKGFYVAQYEAGLDKTTNEIVFKNASIEVNNVKTIDASMNSTYSWYGLYKKMKTFATLDNNEDKVVSSMIWGSQYDAMMNWMAKTEKNVGIEDDTKRNKEIVTGKNTNDVINNIYDLYGCHREWTLLAYDTYSRVYRGGAYNYSSPPAGYDGNGPDNASDACSSRATLYIK